jgi:hypothetical protein
MLHWKSRLAHIARRIPALLMVCLLLACSLLAQDASTGAIRGAVSDISESRIPMATVVFVNMAKGIRYTAVTDAEGRFSLNLLPPGDYQGRATASGMSAQQTPRLHVDLGVVTAVDFKLSPAGAKETVTVSSAPPLIETQSSSISSVVTEQEINSLPLSGHRYSDLALLNSDVTQDPRGLTSSTNGDLAFGGIRGFQSSYLVDGGDNNNAFFAQARGRYREPDQFSNGVVQEFSVSSNTYSAELGRSGGAVVNVITKSGSNHFHGTAFDNFRDSLFNAQQPFTGSKPKGQQEQFGVTLGGPLKKNRAFFFAGYDQHDFRAPTVVQFVNGSSRITPLAATGPVTPGDYEQSDESLVFASAAQLSGQAGVYPARLLGNTGFLKIDFALASREQLTVRLNTSHYYGLNNVFVDPTSPLTTYGISDNGSESVDTQTGSLALMSALSPHLISHFRAQFSRDLQQSSSNTSDPLTKIYSVIDGFGRSNILPREEREQRIHVAETLGWDKGRNSWKFGGDALLSKIYDYFPSNFGGEYIFDPIKVDPFTFTPEIGGLYLTALRAYAHAVPHYYLQSFGSAVSHPDTNEYAAFVQDSIRVTGHFALTLGVRYDLQTFSKQGLLTNPLWPESGKVPFEPYNFAPRGGFAYSVGKEKPLVVRGGYGLFYTRIPQIYTSAIATENGLSDSQIFLNNTNPAARAVFPEYPNVLVNCGQTAVGCDLPASLAQYAESDISAFSRNFRTPEVHQANLSVEKQLSERISGSLSYTFVHGQNLIRARDANLASPVSVSYPVYDSSGINLLGYSNVDSFSTWQMTRSISCPFPPCINPLARPVPELGAVDVFESAASSVYHGLTVSLRRRMANGVYFRLGYTWAHAEDDGQDALVAGSPALVQNSFSPNSEKGPSATDQRHRLVFSWILTPRPFGHGQPVLSNLFNDWKLSGVMNYGSGRPVNPQVIGDPNQDDDSANDRLPGASRNSFVGPNYSTLDVRLSRQILARGKFKLTLMANAFNALNRENLKIASSQNGFQTAASQFVLTDKSIGVNNFPAYYQQTSNFMKPLDTYAARQLELSLKATF